jgi:deoxyribodipyrimidine photo-lyase
LPTHILNRWPPADPTSIAEDLSRLSAFPLDHSVTVVDAKGGSVAGGKQADLFFQKKLDLYAESRNQPEEMMTSGLSPYLHFGHISVHQIFHEVVSRSDWKPDQVSKSTGGQSRGWWGLPEHIESFLDELITWRELGYNMCANTSDFDQYDSLPDWAKKTLAEHENDPREFLYSDEQFEQSQTHDALWNAAQAQLVRTGVIHNYLRMLWGKKILEWSPSPRAALQTMIHLNNKFALDGRNPNSYSGIFWVLGRYDRAWGERPIFGKIRYMSSENTARKVKVKNYIKAFGEPGLF